MRPTTATIASNPKAPMEIYRKIKSFAITVYRDLNNNNLSPEQVKKDKELFFKWWN